MPDAGPAAMRAGFGDGGPRQTQGLPVRATGEDDAVPDHHGSGPLPCPHTGSVLEQEETALAGKRSPVC